MAIKSTDPALYCTVIFRVHFSFASKRRIQLNYSILAVFGSFFKKFPSVKYVKPLSEILYMCIIHGDLIGYPSSLIVDSA